MKGGHSLSRLVLKFRLIVCCLAQLSVHEEHPVCLLRVKSGSIVLGKGVMSLDSIMFSEFESTHIISY